MQDSVALAVAVLDSRCKPAGKVAVCILRLIFAAGPLPELEYLSPLALYTPSDLLPSLHVCEVGLFQGVQFKAGRRMQPDAVCNVRRTGSPESCLIMHRIPLFSRQENKQ